jgi:Flp pilus assembly protein TadG
MAFVLPVFLTLVLGQIEMSRLGMVAQLLTTAAREGCRVAVISGRTQADVQARVGQVLAGSRITVDAFQPTPANWASAAGGTPITLTLSVPYARVSWLPVPSHFGATTVRASATFNCERP